jgi:calcineurin-like phosphoesterase family protein
MRIILRGKQKLYFSSDSHYSHSGICRGVSHWPEGRGTRDFQTLEEMNDAIVNGINSVVCEDDVFVHMGDWSFGGFDKIGEFRNRINCKNVYLFLGNHDHHITNNKDGIQRLFVEVSKLDTLEVRVPCGSVTKKYSFECCHHPIASWDGLSRGRIHLHGHVHLPPHLKINTGRAMDVGADGNNLIPYSLEEILELMDGRPLAHLVLPKDHHTEGE